MADLSRTIEILFEGTNKTGSTIASVGRDLDELNYRVGTVAQPMADLTAGIIKLDTVLAALAGAGLAYAFNESSKLQSAFTELKKVVGDNDEALAIAKGSAKDLSVTYGESAAAILESTANYVQAGFSVTDAMGLARTGMDLVIAGGVDASQSSEILIATLKGFKAPAEEAGRLLDILNEVSNRYATDIEQLGIGMAGISPIARTMGFSFEETAGLLTPVIEVFRSGDEAAVALKTGLLKLLDDSKPVQEALSSIGVSQRDSNGELRSGKDILLDVSSAFQDLDQNQKLFVTQQLVGIHQSARMVEVFDGLGKSTEITAVAMNAAGSAAKEVAERLKDPEVAVNRLVQSIKNLASATGDEFQQSGIDVMDGFTDIFSAIEKAVDTGAFEPIFDALNDFLEGVAADLQDIARNLPEALEGVAFDGFVDSIVSLKETISGLFDGIDFDDPESLRLAIQKVVDTFESLVNFSEGMAEVFVTVAKYISGLIDGFDSLDSNTRASIGSISGAGAAVAAATSVIGGLTSAVVGVGTAINLLSGRRVAGLISSLVGSGGLSSALSVIQAHPLIAAGAAGLAMGTAWRKMVPEVDQAAQSVLGFIDAHTGLLGVSDQQTQNEQEWIGIQGRWKAIMADRAEAAARQAEESKQAIQYNEVNAVSVEWLSGEMEKLGILVEAPKTIHIETAEAEEQLQKLEYFRESTGTWETITVPVDASQIEKAKDTIEEIPAVKRFELETDLKIEEFKANAQTAQAALQFKAQVDIAEIEAGTERITTLSNNITEMFNSTGDMINSLFDSWDSDTSLSEKWAIKDSLAAEQERRDRTLKMQEELNTAQVKYMEARTERLESGEALITVEGDGLAPHLEMIMWELFAAIQIRANQEGLGSLLLGGP